MRNTVFQDVTSYRLAPTFQKKMLFPSSVEKNTKEVQSTQHWEEMTGIGVSNWPIGRGAIK